MTWWQWFLVGCGALFVLGFAHWCKHVAVPMWVLRKENNALVEQCREAKRARTDFAQWEREMENR